MISTDLISLVFNGKIYAVKAIKIHPLYGTIPHGDCDLAMLFLDHPVADIQPALQDLQTYNGIGVTAIYKIR